MNENEMNNDSLLASNEEVKRMEAAIKKSKFSPPEELTESLKKASTRYNEVVGLISEGKGVLAGLKATNDPEYQKVHNTLYYFITCLESRVK